ncbi:ABC transporter substrate-binding protein [Streptomyces sp. NBC_00690]|uniref:ABC transporter substrate-binding protein n=1 Tax=Streptomyces sp. NBC_00690 TaxID=2975808 RepID=UPI002E2E47C4|nr:ABC transporter substrate-binding protein [Streptomyces sp. NBC_00690]
MTHSATPTALWFTRCPVPTATGIAADLGWLADEFAPDGIAVRSLQDAPAATARDHHYTHALDGLFREGGNVPALWARSRGEPTRLIGLTWIEERQVILVAADSAVHEPAGLRGKRLAIPRHPLPIDFWRAMALRGFDGALSTAGLSLADTVLVDVPADAHADQWSAELAALREGTVDAVYAKGATALAAAARYGARIAVELDDHPDRRTRINNGTPRPITVRESLLEERPDLVSRYLTVLVRAADWAADHTDELAGVLSRETGADAVSVAGAYRAHSHRDLHIDLSDERLDLLTQQEHALRAHGFLAAPVDVRDWAAPEPLRRAAAHGHHLATAKDPQ